MTDLTDKEKLWTTRIMWFVLGAVAAYTTVFIGMLF